MYEKLLERRSVRKYKPEQVSDELLDAVLEAALNPLPGEITPAILSDIPVEATKKARKRELRQ